MATQIGRPKAAEIVFRIRDEPAERHVTALVAEPTICRVDAVIEPARTVLIEILKTGHGTVHDSAGRRHGPLAHHAADLGMAHHGVVERAARDQRQREGLAGTALPCGRFSADQPQAGGGTFFTQATGSFFAHRSHIPDGRRFDGQGSPRAEKPV